MVLDLADGDGGNLLCNKSGQAFVHGHAQTADAFAAESDGCGENEIGTVWLKQIRGAYIGSKSFCDESNNIHQRFRRLAALGGEVLQLLQGQDVFDFSCTWVHNPCRLVSFQSGFPQPPQKPLRRGRSL
jgi:hypothetical protein